MRPAARRARGDGAAGGAVPPWYRLPDAPAPAGDTVVVGAGLAGCHLAHELALRGRRATVVDAANGPAGGASGNPVGIVKPFVTREPSVGERFHADAWAHLQALLADPALATASDHRPVGALQLVDAPWPARDDLDPLDALRAARSAGTGLDAPHGALRFPAAGSIDPRALCRALLDRAGADARFERELHALERIDGRWHVHLHAPHGDEVLHADTVVLANGPALVATPWTAWFPVTPARGQMSRFRVDAGPHTVVAGRSWAIPDGDGVWAGATYDRDDIDPAPRTGDDAANRAALEALLQDVRPGDRPTASSAGVRATTPDRLPFAGPVPELDTAMHRYADLARGRPPAAYPTPHYIDGLAVLGGFGSRGLVTAGWCAHLLAAWLAGDGAGLQAATPHVGPMRFVVRPLVRGKAPRLREMPA